MLNLFYPQTCLHCKNDLHFLNRKHLCQKCEETIQPIPEPFCVDCGTHLPYGGMRCFHCKKGKFYLSCIRSAGTFTGAFRELIHQFKYDGKDYLCEDLARFLLRAWNQYGELHETEIVLSVPLHPRKLRERRYNQSELLAKKFVSALQEGRVNDQSAKQHSSEASGARPLGQGFSTSKVQLSSNGLLMRVKETVPQTQLPREKRIENMESAFQADPNSSKLVWGKNILLIDDVCTTGATLNACAKALQKAGAKKVFGLTLARD